MSISSEITRLSGNVSAALTAIGAKGVTIPSGANSDDLATLIAQIEGGGGSVTWETLYEGNATIVASNPNYISIMPFPETINEGETWRITWDGTPYICTPVYSSQISRCFIGNSTIVGGSDSGNNEPFWAYKRTATQLAFSTNQSAGTIALVIERQTTSSATLITKTISSNGTYNASSDGADGYSQVTVNVPSGGASMNVQVAQGVDRVATTSYTAVSGQSITVEVTGTYDVYWTGFQSSTGGTNGSQLYIDGTAYGSAQTTFSNHGQSIKLTGVQLTAGQVVSVRARARGTNYYMYVGNLTIVQTE